MAFLVLNSMNLLAEGSIKASKKSVFKSISYKCVIDLENEDGLDTTPQSPPFGIDDPETPGCKTWEVNLIISGDLAKDSKSFDLPVVDLNYGIGENLEISLETPYMYLKNDQENSLYGVGKTEVGIKWLFYKNESTGTSVSINPKIEFNPMGDNAASVHTGLIDPGHTISIPLLMSQKISETKNGDIIVILNLGYNKTNTSTTSSSISAGAGIGFPIAHNLALITDIEAEEGIYNNFDRNRDKLIKANVGFMKPINKNLSLYGAVGKSIVSSDGLNHTYFTIGIKGVFR
jgi:hypothetical protein